MSNYYAELNDTLDSLSLDTSHESIVATDTIAKAAKSLHSIEGNIAEDAQLLSKASSKVVGFTSNATNVVNTYDKEKLADHIKYNKGLWHFTFWYEVPVFAFLYDTTEDTPKPQKTRTYNKINKLVHGSVKAPAKVASIRNNAEEKPEAAVELNNYLKTCDNAECSYFHLVLHPTSFTRTIENIYNVSLLIKNKKVGFYIDEDTGLPFLKCVKKDPNKPSSERKQFIQTIDKKQWSDLVEALHITKPLLNCQEEEEEEDDNMSDENQS